MAHRLQTRAAKLSSHQAVLCAGRLSGAIRGPVTEVLERKRVNLFGENGLQGKILTFDTAAGDKTSHRLHKVSHLRPMLPRGSRSSRRQPRDLHKVSHLKREALVQPSVRPPDREAVSSNSNAVHKPTHLTLAEADRFTNHLTIKLDFLKLVTSLTLHKKAHLC